MIFIKTNINFLFVLNIIYNLTDKYWIVISIISNNAINESSLHLRYQKLDIIFLINKIN